MRAAALGLLAALLPLSARAAPPVKMSAELGIGSVARADTWTPVQVDLENTGPAVSGSVIAHFSGPDYSKTTVEEPVELTTGARKRVILQVRLRSGHSHVTLSFEDRKGVEADPVELGVDALEDRTVVVGVVSMATRTDPGLRPLITADTRMVALDPDQLPEAWADLRAFDALILRDPDAAKLGPGRITALRNWVSAGGRLVVASSAKWRAMDEPAFTEMLPVRVTGVRTAKPAELPYDFASHSGEVPVAVSEFLRGQVLEKNADGSPFAAVGPWGLGTVGFIGADPGVFGDLGWGVRSLWSQLLDLPAEKVDDPNPNLGQSGFSAEKVVAQELARIPPLKPPSVFLVTLIIGLYVLVVGPGDYFLLRRIGKLHWTWATYPLAIAVFSTVIYAYARLSRSSEMIVRTLTLVDTPAEPPDAPSPLHVFAGVYSPRAGRYRVEVRVPGAVFGGTQQEGDLGGMGGGGGGEFDAMGGRSPALKMAIPIWSMRGVDMLAAGDSPPPFLVARESDGAIQVSNSGTEPLEYVGLLVGDRVIDGGRVDPGGNVRLRQNQAGKRLAELPGEISSSQFGDKHSTEDLSRVARVFAYATDPPTTAGEEAEAYYLPARTRRLGALERPRAAKGKPMVFVITRTADLPIAVEGNIANGSGLTIWRRPVPAIGG